MKKNKIIYITFFIIIFCVFFCSCSNDQQKQNAITDPQEYVNNLAQQGYTSVYNSFVFEKTDKNKKTWTAPFAGIKTFKIPVDMINAKGTIAAAGGSESIPGSGLVAVDVLYMAMTEAEYKQTVGNLALYSYYAGSDAGALQAYQQLAGAYTSSATKPAPTATCAETPRSTASISISTGVRSSRPRGTKRNCRSCCRCLRSRTRSRSPG